MKRITTLLLVSAILLTNAILLVGCDQAGEDDDAGNGSMTAMIDGQRWSAANATANKVTALGQTIITIAGAKTNGENMVLTLTGINQTGEYAVGAKVGASFSPEGQSVGGSYTARSGMLQLTRLDDDRAEGTFAFELKPLDNSSARTVTEGRFDVAFGPAIGG